MTEAAAPAPAIWDGGDLADLLDLEPLPGDLFRARRNEFNEHRRIYGGQLMGQAMMAAARTVPQERPASFLQFLFVAGGMPQHAIDYQVSNLQEGKRFSSRNVRGMQADGRIICDAGVSFAKAIDGPAHQSAPAENCGLHLDPQRLATLDDIVADEAREVERTIGYPFRRHSAMDFRPAFIEDLLRPEAAEPRMRFFIRMRRRLPDDQALHAAAFAYLSDFWINFAACIPHVHATARAGRKLYVASLNHTLWLHRPLRADEWLLFDCRSPSSAQGRGLSIARIHNRSGDLVASATQECLLAPTE